jgi:hypothetical protein
MLLLLEFDADDLLDARLEERELVVSMFNFEGSSTNKGRVVTEITELLDAKCF